MLDISLRYLFPDIDFFPGRDCDLVDDGKGPYIAAWRRQEKQPTLQELEAIFPVAKAAFDAEVTTKQTLENQQAAGIIEAKRAYARMQAIIDGVDTATIAQLRLAVKEIARDIQHLIHAAVK